MAKLTVVKLRAEVKKRSKVIADQRDALQDLISEAEEICGKAANLWRNLCLPARARS